MKAVEDLSDLRVMISKVRQPLVVGILSFVNFKY